MVSLTFNFVIGSCLTGTSNFHVPSVKLAARILIGKVKSLANSPRGLSNVIKKSACVLLVLENCDCALLNHGSESPFPSKNYNPNYIRLLRLY